ncbi:MAG: ABC transporter ATP-binding protein [Candidatus Thermoplasmatota archaeon]|nr:ABC transporter ATP-binding protein [Candidatus Thermoplasmatota archaeon]
MNGVETPALRGVNLKINKGEFVAIMGPSGSGKSTLLHMIGALDKPTSGKVILDGVDISTLQESDLARLRGTKVGIVFQFFNLHPTLTALENIELPMIVIERDKNTRQARARELLHAVGLEHRAHHLPSQMSGGEQQRIAIARALANDPEIILADELTGNLDSKTKAEIMNFLLRLQQEKNMTVTVITHEPEIAQYAETVIRIVDGTIAHGG